MKAEEGQVIFFELLSVRCYILKRDDYNLAPRRVSKLRGTLKPGRG